MLRRIGSHVRNQWMGALSLFLVLAGGTAYAANTISSGDIVDGQVKTPDLANAAVTTEKLSAGAVTTEKIKDATVAGRDVLDDSLKGADIDESTLSSAPSAIRLDAEIPGHVFPAPLIPVLKTRGIALLGKCTLDTGGGTPSTSLDLLATGPAGSVVNYSGVRDRFDPEPLAYLDGNSLSATPARFNTFVASGLRGSYGLNYIHGVFRSATSTVSFEANLVATEGSGGVCQVHGTAVAAS